MMAERDEPEPSAERRSQLPALLREAAQKLMPVLLTAGSLLGFVAFAGAVILWTRFEAIHVPPEQAIKAVPRAELVATGSALLLLFGFLGALALIVAYLVDRSARATPEMARALLGLVGVEGVAAIYIFRGDSNETTLGAAVFFGLLTVTAVVATFPGLLGTYRNGLRSRKNEREWTEPGPGRLHRASGDPRLAPWRRWSILGLFAALLALAAALACVELPGAVATVLWVLGPLGGAALVVLLVGALTKAAGDRRREETAAASSPAAPGGEEVEEGRESLSWRAFERIAEAVAIARGVRRGRLPESRAARARKRARERAAEEKEELERRRLLKPRPSRLDMSPEGALLFLFMAGIAIAMPCVILGELLLAVPLAVAFVLGAGLWRVATLSKRSFVWFGLALFVSVPLFGTFTLMAHNLSDPQVQPVALIRETDGPDEAIQGLYVTEGDDRVYFANVATEGCSKDLVDHSGRLFWVPTDEVVAMAVGPLQDVEEAGKSALEMSYALTPGIETLAGENVTLARETDEDGEGGEDAEAAGSGEAAPSPPSGGRRLESAGPAVRPDFGAGLRLVPEDAEPGDVVELRMSVTRKNPDGEGFGIRPKGRTLRLGGVRLAILRIPAQNVDLAEYAETVEGQVIPLERPEEGADVEEASFSERFVRFKPGRIQRVKGAVGLSLRAEADGRLTPVTVDAKKGTTGRPTVVLPNGDEAKLRYQLLKLAWSPTSIKFRLPTTADDGVVSTECRQLAGQPVLTVAQPPTARIAVRMRAGSQRVIFDGRRSTGESEKGELTRHWVVAGRGIGGKRAISMFLPPRLKPYSVRLTVTDANGRSDTASLRLLRLPASRFRFGTDRPSNRKAVTRVRDAVREDVAKGSPAAIELHGHADSVGSAESNLQLSLDRVELVRKSVFAKRGDSDPGDLVVNDDPPVPMTVRAFGETCQIVRRPGPQATNRRVEVFLLGPGATVATAESCRAGRIRRSSW